MIPSAGAAGRQAVGVENVRKLVPAICIAAAASTGAAAFPTWMGVYGGFRRHSGENPGTFSILVNDDYPALRVGVGIRVDNGEWTFHPMRYTCGVNGDSVWMFTPATPFPAGSLVRYYFHAWDDRNDRIWDSNGGSDYTFRAPVNGALVQGRDQLVGPSLDQGLGG